MKKYLLHSLITTLLLCSTSLIAQVYQGTVVDAQTKRPLPYANIGIKGKSIGGITDGTGAFAIDISKADKTDSLIVSYLGYKSVSFYVANIITTQHTTVALIPRARILDNIEITAKPEKILLGNNKKSHYRSGWGDFNSAAGRAIGTLIPASEIKVKVNKVFFHCENEFDSIRLRINLLRKFENKIIDLSAQNKNVIITLSKRKGWVEVNLPEWLMMDKGEEWIVAIEWLEAWAKPRPLEDGGSYIFTISQSRNNGFLYRRNTPQELAELTPVSLTPSIYLECFAVKQ